MVPTLFMTWPKTSITYLRPLTRVTAGKVALNMSRAFVDGLTDNDEKVASSEKRTLCMTKMAKITRMNILFMTKTAEKPYKGVSPSYSIWYSKA